MRQKGEFTICPLAFPEVVGILSLPVNKHQALLWAECTYGQKISAVHSTCEPTSLSKMLL